MRLYVSALETKGFKVLVRTSVDDALDIARSPHQPVHILVLDVMMPPGQAFQHENTFEGMTTGFFLAEAMKNIFPTQPIVLLTNLTSPELLSRFCPEPRVRLVHKFDYPPFDFAQLVCDILEITESEKHTQ